MSRATIFAAAVGLTLILVGAAPIDSVLGNVVLDRRSTLNGQAAVVFPHWQHRSRFRCYACHPDLFAMQAGAADITMDAIRAGQSCGICHNGKVAFEAGFETCRSCHSHVEP